MASDAKTKRVSGTTELLTKWLVEVTVNEEAHYATVKRLVTKQTLVGYPVAVLNAVVASSVFATLSKEIAIGWRIATGVFSVLAAILSAAAAFGRYGERAETHRRTAVKFAEVRLLLEQIIAAGTGTGPDADKHCQEVRKQLNGITDAAPAVPEDIWKITHDRIVNSTV